MIVLIRASHLKQEEDKKFFFFFLEGPEILVKSYNKILRILEEQDNDFSKVQMVGVT